VSLSVLVIDDDESIRETLIDFFASLGYTARGASTATEGRQLAREHAPNVVLLDLRLPDASGLVALEALRADDPDVAIIVLSGYADVRSAVRAMHHGAADVLEKPVDLDTLSAAVTRASERGRLRQEVAVLRAQTRSAHQSYVTEPIKLPHTIEQLIDLAARNLDAPVLLQGETGTGKGFVARQIHDRSERNSAPWSRSTAHPSPRRSSKASCSDTNEERLPTPDKPSEGFWKWRPPGPSFSTKSPR